jgi:uncharacterized protein YxjI
MSINKKIIMFYAFVSSVLGGSLHGGIHSEVPYQFTVKQQDYLLSSEFHIQSGDSYNAVVKKSSFRVSSNYDLSDKDGWQATGTRRILSLGSLASWGAEIDIYDTRKQRIAMIEGKAITMTKARFNIYEYDDEGNYKWIGIACLDGKAHGFTIYQASNNPIYPIARLDRVFVPNAKDYWSVDVYEPSMIDDRIVRIFAAFALDTQEAFLADDIPAPIKGK